MTGLVVRDEDERGRHWADAMRGWLARSRSDRTRQTYLESWRVFLGWRCVALWDVTPEIVSAWRDEQERQGRRPNTIKVRLAALSSFYRYAVKGGLCRDNPLDTVGFAQAEPYAEAKWLTAEDARRLLAAIDRGDTRGRRDYALLALMLATGLRVDEARRLTLGAVHDAPQGAFLRFTGKGGVETAMPLSASLLAALRAMLADRPGARFDAPLFDRLRRDKRDGEPLTRAAIANIVHARCEAAGLPRLNVHALRHTCGTLLYERHQGIDAVQNLMRHKHIETTARYIHRVRDRRRAYVDELSDILTG